MLRRCSLFPSNALPARETPPPPHLSYFCAAFIASCHVWKKQQLQLNFHNALVIVRENITSIQVEEEVLPGTRRSPSPLSVIPIEPGHVSHSPTRKWQLGFSRVLGRFFAEKTSHHLCNDAICMHHPTQISFTVGLPSP